MILLSIVLFTSVLLNDNTAEQIALDYFATRILPDHYFEYKKVYFTGYTEPEKTIHGPFLGCFNLENEFVEFLRNTSEEKSNRLELKTREYPKLKLSNRDKSNGLNLHIYRSIRKSDVGYVYLYVFINRQFIDHYLLQISTKENKVIECCLKQEIM
jgi:hypothetical protein